MSSPEYLQFGMTDGDMDDIYEPTRKKFKMSKNQATYGVWYDSDEEDGDGGERNKYGVGKKKKLDYSAPISFVSDGNKIAKENNPADDVTNLIDYSSSEDEEEEEPKQAQQKPAWRTKGPSHTNVATKQNEKLGNWEKHTKGIGHKLLEKMGHVAGMGLGKNLQGRINPVEATQREGKKGGVGLYGSERTDKQSHKETYCEEVEEIQPQLKRWKKSEKDKVPARKDISIADMIKNSNRKYKASHSSNIDVSNVPIIDMRNKQQKVLTGYHTINTKQYKIIEHDPNSAKTQERFFDLPELVNNLELLSEMAEEKLLKAHRTMESQDDSLVNIDYEVDKAYKDYQEEEEQIDRMEEIVDILDKYGQICTEFGIVEATEECSELLQKLKIDFHQEFVMYDLITEIISIITPSIEREFQDWNPLQNPGQGTHVMEFIKDFLSTQSSDPYNSFDVRGPFDELIWKIVMPRIFFAVAAWNVRQVHYMIDIVEVWQPILPGWIMTTFLDQHIFTKVKKELDAWEPHRDPIPVQNWVQPWALIIENKKSILYATIRDKLGRIFGLWEPQDPTGKVMISAWVGLFDQDDMNAFLASFILPKLLLSLQSNYFTLRGQTYKQFNSVMDWADIMPHKFMVDGLLERFFPNFFMTLSHWVNSKCCEKAELNNWFTSWMACFPEKLKSDPEIKKNLSSALMIVNHNGSIPLPSNHVPSYYTQVPAMIASSFKTSNQQNTGQVKARFEQYCRQKNITIQSMSKAKENQEQIYKIGNLLIRFDDEFVYYFENLKWSAAKSFEQLIQKAKLH